MTVEIFLPTKYKRKHKLFKAFILHFYEQPSLMYNNSSATIEKDNFPTFITKKYEIKRNITVHNNKKIRIRHKRNGYKSFMLFIQPEKNPPSDVHIAFFFFSYNQQQRKGQKFSINLPYQLTPIVHLLTYFLYKCEHEEVKCE